jgi:hypothetical protein
MLTWQKTTFLALAALWLVTARPAAAQLQTGFEPSDGYDGSATGTVLTGQNGWSLPDSTSNDFSVYTYDSNALGLPTNPNGGTQFIAAQALGNGQFARAQMDFDFSTANQWTVEYDIAAHFNDPLPAFSNVGSFTLQPDGNFIALNIWDDDIEDGNGSQGQVWDTYYQIYDAQGNALPDIYAPSLDGISSAWIGLVVDNWYHQSVTFDLTLNQIISASITDLTSGNTTTVDLTNANPPWLLFPSSPSAVRFFVGGGSGSNPGNVMAIDNFSITPVTGGN